MALTPVLSTFQDGLHWETQAPELFCKSWLVPSLQSSSLINIFLLQMASQLTPLSARCFSLVQVYKSYTYALENSLLAKQTALFQGLIALCGVNLSLISYSPLLPFSFQVVFLLKPQIGASVEGHYHT